MSNRPREVVQIKFNDERTTFNSIKQASLTTGISTSSIKNCLKGISQSACGYRWEYLDSKANDKGPTFKLYRFVECDDAVIEFANSFQRKNKRRLLPKIQYFVSLILDKVNKKDLSPRINFNTLARTIGENNQTTRRIIDFWINLGVVERVQAHHKQDGEFVSARYTITEAYRKLVSHSDEFIIAQNPWMHKLLFQTKDAQEQPVEPQIALLEPPPLLPVPNFDDNKETPYQLFNNIIAMYPICFEAEFEARTMGLDKQTEAEVLNLISNHFKRA